MPIGKSGRAASERGTTWRGCLLANILVLAVAYSGTTLGPVLAAVLFLLPVASFVALFLGWKAVFGHQAVVTVGLGLVLAGPLHLGAAALVDVLASLMLVAASMTIQLLVASVWSRGAVDPDTGLPNGIGSVPPARAAGSRGRLRRQGLSATGTWATGT